MRNRLILSILAAFLAVPLAATVSLASIWGSHKKSDEKSVSVDLAQNTILPGGAQLKPGTYRVLVPENEKKPEVVFYHNGKEVARAQASLVNETKKNSETEVLSTTQGKSQVMNEIRPQGWTDRLVFSKSTGSGSSHAGA